MRFPFRRQASRSSETGRQVRRRLHTNRSLGARHDVVGVRRQPRQTGNLLNILDILVGAESLPGDVIYVAIYPANVNQAAFAGWAVGRWIISDGTGETFAHEILHHTGVPQHAPCGQPANVDAGFPDYPTFSPLPAASIGEVGFDWAFLQAHNPQTTFDLMPYCPPKWISSYNYQRAFNALTPLPPPPPPPSSFEREDHVDVAFLRFPPDNWIVVDLSGFPRPRPPRPPIGKSEWHVQLLDERGAEIFRGPAPIQSWDNGGENEPPMVQTTVPWRKDAAAIALCNGSEVLTGARLLPAPELKVEFPSSGEIESGTGAVRFRASGSKRVVVAIRASVDGGATWTASVVTDHEGKVPVALLLGDEGDDCYLEVVATSGYHAAARTSERFRVRPRERVLRPWSSAEKGRANGSRPVRLFAIIEGGVTASDDLSWYSDLGWRAGARKRTRSHAAPGPAPNRSPKPPAFPTPSDARAHRRIAVSSSVSISTWTAGEYRGPDTVLGLMRASSRCCISFDSVTAEAPAFSSR